MLVDGGSGYCGVSLTLSNLEIWVVNAIIIDYLGAVYVHPLDATILLYL